MNDLIALTNQLRADLMALGLIARHRHVSETLVSVAAPYVLVPWDEDYWDFIEGYDEP